MSRKLMAMMLAIGLVIGLVGGFFGGYYYNNFKAEEGSLVGGGQQGERVIIGSGALVEPISESPKIHKLVGMNSTDDLSNPYTCPSDIPAKFAMPFYLRHSNDYYKRAGDPYDWFTRAVGIKKVINPNAGSLRYVGVERIYEITEEPFEGDGLNIFATLSEQYTRHIKEPKYFYQVITDRWLNHFSEQDLTGPTQRGGSMTLVTDKHLLCQKPGFGGTGGGGE